MMVRISHVDLCLPSSDIPSPSRSRKAERMAADFILRPYLIKPKLHGIVETTLDPILELAHEFSSRLADRHPDHADDSRASDPDRAGLAGTKWQ